MSKEQDTQAKIVKYLNTIGYAFVTVKSGTRGIPDVIACIQGKFYAFEVKKKKGRISRLQQYNIERIRHTQGRAYVVYSLEEVKIVLEKKGVGLTYF